MSHDYHGAAANFSSAQLLNDYCAECRSRSQSPWLAIQHMDPERFAVAWRRAIDWERGLIDDVSKAEVPLLRVLWAFALQMERRGFSFGPCPEPFDLKAELPL